MSRPHVDHIDTKSPAIAGLLLTIGVRLDLIMPASVVSLGDRMAIKLSCLAL